MNLVYEASFARDLKRIRDKQLLQRVRDLIDELKAVQELADLPGAKKLQGHNTFYRVRLGDYRVGIELVDNQVILVRFLHRKDIYRYFP